MELNSQIFTWGNYEEDPKNIMGVDTIPTQKDATYTNSANGVFTGSVEESFFTNIDKSVVSNPAAVIGEVPMDIIDGKGAVVPGLEIHYITSKAEYDAAMDDGTEPKHTEGYLHKANYTGTTWTEGMAWAVAIVEKETWLRITANGSTDGVVIKDVTHGMEVVDNMFKRGTDHKYLIVDKGEVFVNNTPMSDVTKVGFIAVA